MSRIGIKTWGHGLLLAAGMWLGTAPAQPRWDQVLTDAQGVYYIDGRSVQTKGQLRTFLSLRDYLEPQATYDGLAYLSALAKIEIDCKSNEAIVLEMSYYTGRMLGGQKALRESNFHTAKPIEKNAPIQRFAQRVC